MNAFFYLSLMLDFFAFVHDLLFEMNINAITSSEKHLLKDAKKVLFHKLSYLRASSVVWGEARGSHLGHKTSRGHSAGQATLSPPQLSL